MASQHTHFEGFRVSKSIVEPTPRPLTYPLSAGGAPGQLFLGIDNSMTGDGGDRAVCAVTLFAPYWLENRTGVDLGFQARAHSLYAVTFKISCSHCRLVSGWSVV